MPYGPPPTPRGRRSARSSHAEEPRAESADEAVRVTVDLTPAEYQLLNVWLARASLQLDQPVSAMTVARGIRAMIQAAAADPTVSNAILATMTKDDQTD